MSESWRVKDQYQGAVRLTYELEFLPANIELAETPIHPAPLWTARILIGGTLLIAMVAVFGRLDIVAVAPGQILPGANIKIVQSAVTAVVQKILVQSGDRVRAGQPLMELDPTQARVDVEASRTRAIDSRLAEARARALLDAQRSDRMPQVPPINGVQIARELEAQTLATSTFSEYRDREATMQAELRKREAELETARQEVDKLQQIAPIAQQQAADYGDLVKQGYVSVHDAQAKRRSAIELAHDLSSASSHVTETSAAVDEERQDLATTIATFRRQQLEAIDAAQQEVAASDKEEIKATARQGYMHITSPVNGIVQQLNVHTVGGVVTSAQSLMEIVPDEVLEVEARVNNRDVGFVRPGQVAIVKIQTFPYTRFGYLQGTVSKVANDAVSDRKRGLVFLARIKLATNRMKIDDRWVDLSPGMEVSVEVRTGRQTVLQYFLGPLIRVGHESLGER